MRVYLRIVVFIMDFFLFHHIFQYGIRKYTRMCELAYVARELENSVFTVPRTMLTHARIFANAILENVMEQEEIHDKHYNSLKERIDILDENGLLTKEICDALHHVRLSGNQAAHQVRPFRRSEERRVGKEWR